jgi:hypothetical protein
MHHLLHASSVAGVTSAAPACKLEDVRSLLLLVALALAVAVQTGQPKKPTPQPTPAPTPAPAPAPDAAPVVLHTCDYVEPQDAASLLGADASASTAPSQGALLSCGYTSPGGNALTVSIADYGIPSIAKQFFEKTWELTKTATVEDSLGTSAFALISADPSPRVSITAWKAEKIVTIEASGVTLAKPQTLPVLRAMMVKLLPKLAPSPAPPPPQP